MALDRYAYVNNNPLIYNDPSGHFGVLIAGALGGALGGVIYGYGSQVINNLNHGMSFGQALTTNISGSSIAFFTVVGGLMGTVVAPMIAPVASSVASVITPAGIGTTSTGAAVANQTCGGDFCMGELEQISQTSQGYISTINNSIQNSGNTSQQIIPQLTQGNIRYGLEHIVYRHWWSSGFSDVSKFSSDTTLRSLRSLINQSAGPISQWTQDRSLFVRVIDAGRVIGINKIGNPTPMLKVIITEVGKVISAYPY